MTSQHLFNTTTYFYLCSAIFFILSFKLFKKILAKLGSFLAYSGFTIQTIAIVFRWKDAHDRGWGLVPVSNLYETSILSSWIITAIFVFLAFKYKSQRLGTFIIPFSLIIMVWAQLLFGTDIEPVVPALKFNSLRACIISFSIGYAIFAVACGTSIMYLFCVKRVTQEKYLEIISTLPKVEVQESLNKNAIRFGIILLTINIVTGAIWSKSAWGIYWSWDEKEIWTLITWITYIIILCLTEIGGWSGKRGAWLSIGGFAIIIFSYFGAMLLYGGHKCY
jgi:cytochrome c-type biogenesis protein CcsB